MDTPDRRYVVVLQADSGARLRERESLRVPSRCAVGEAMMTIRTQYADEGFTSTVPRRLWIEIVGISRQPMTEVINAYWTLANEFVPRLAVATNAPIGDLDVHLAFDGTEGQHEHEFFQHLVPDQIGLPTAGRAIPLAQSDVVHQALEASPHRARIARACSFYREALRYLRPGQEVLQIVFLWMAVEALTKVALRQACVANACSEDALVALWGLAQPGDSLEAITRAKRALDGEARRRYIFHNDSECQRATVAASDGFEHGFNDFDVIRRLAAEAKSRGVAQHVRRAIFELLEVEPDVIGFLTSHKYENPREAWPITKYMRGTFLGRPEDLAAADQQYPVLRWEGKIKENVLRDDGRYDITPDDRLTVLAGDGVEFVPGSFEVYLPATDPLEAVDDSGNSQAGGSRDNDNAVGHDL